MASTFKQCFQIRKATAVVSTHSRHRLILAYPSSAPSRAGMEEDTDALQSWTLHPRFTPGQVPWRRLSGCSAGTPSCPSSLTLTSISLRMTSMMLPITMRKSKTFQGSPK